MKPQISITKSDSRNENNLTMNIHVAASRNDAIEMLAYGSRAIMDTLDIPLMVFLEALMNARETSSLEKIIIDTSKMANIFEGRDGF